MSAPEPPHVETLLEQCILALEAGDQPAMDSVLAANPAVAPLLRQRIEHLSVLGILKAPRPLVAIPDRLGEFRLLRQIGRGGMGVVYLAEQTSLQREVALKLVHPELLVFRQARERFRREVLAVARLQHPGIVPILTSGEAEGIPFYAMELVAGASLAEVRNELAGSAPTDLDGAALRAALQRAMAKKQDDTPVQAAPVFQGAWAPVCCRLVLGAARALQHAHEQRVLHRDLKPSNLLLTASGEVRIIDFGLASAEGEQRITRSQTTLGSLPYMAPEQLRGEIDRVDVPSDIYALGVTLYELLTLTLPYGDGSGTTRERILAGLAEMPARRNPIVHADAEAICLKAMDLDPARRYGSAAELAEDLEAFLAHRSVRARRPSWSLRAIRWSRRHPGLAAAAALAFVVLVPGPLLFGLQQSAAAARIQRALDEASTQRQLAEHNFEQAMLAVDQMLVRTASSRLTEHPRTTQLRRSLLEDALAFHERLLANTPDDLADMQVRLARARSQVRLGSLNMSLGDLPRATGVLEQGSAALEELLPKVTGANRTIVQTELALAHKQVGAVSSRMGKTGLPEARARAAIALLQEVRAADPRDGRAAGLLHDCTLELAGELGNVERFAEGLVLLDGLDAELREPPPTHLDAGLALGWHLNHVQVAEKRGVLQTLAGDLEKAKQSFLDGLARLDALPASVRDDDGANKARVDILERLGQVGLQRRDWDEGIRWFDLGITTLEAIVARDPDLPRWRSQLAGLLGTRAMTRTERGEVGRSTADYDRAIALHEQVVAEAPTDHRYRRRLAITLGQRAATHLASGRPTEALADLEAAHRSFEHLRQVDRTDPTHDTNHAVTLSNRAKILGRMRRFAEARPLVDRAIEIVTAGRAPEEERRLIELHSQAGELAMEHGDTAAGQASWQRAAELADQWLAASPNDPLRQATAALIALNRGTMFVNLGRRSDATATWQAALPLARASAPRSAFGKQMLAVLLLRLTEAALRDDDRAAARDWFTKAIAETGVNPGMLRGERSLIALFDHPALLDLSDEPLDTGK
jgi:serine/threonine protein kinase